jgi:hypothetical protein
VPPLVVYGCNAATLCFELPAIAVARSALSYCLDDNRHSWLTDTAELGERAVIGATAAYAPLAAGELKLFLHLMGLIPSR